MYLITMTEENKKIIEETDNAPPELLSNQAIIEDEESFKNFISNRTIAFIKDSKIYYDAEMSAIKIEEEICYDEKRFLEYPDICEQLDAIWKILDPPKDSDAYKIKQHIEKIKNDIKKPSNPKCSRFVSDDFIIFRTQDRAPIGPEEIDDIRKKGKRIRKFNIA